MIKFIWTLLFTFFMFSRAFALDVSAAHQSTTELRPKLTYFRDAEHKLTISDVIKTENATKFEDLGDRKSLGYIKDSVWLRFSIENLSTTPQPLLIELAYPIIDFVDFYVVDKGNVEKEVSVGQSRTRLEESKLFPNPNLQFILAANQSKEIYVKIKSYTSINTNINIWNKDVFKLKTIQELFFYGLYYGGLLALIIYNLFLAVTTRDKVYGLYVAFLSVTTLFFAAWNGVGNIYLWNNTPSLAPKVFSVLMSLLIVTAVEFCIGFLEIKKNLPKWYKLLRIPQTGAILLAIVAAVKPELQPAKFLSVLALPSAIGVFSAGIVLAKRGQRQAKIYVIGWTIFLFSIVYAALGYMGVVPLFSFSKNIAQIGSFFEVLVFSIGLGDKINTERRARHVAQRQMIDSLNKVNNDLNNLVETGKELTSQASLQGLDNKLKSALGNDLGEGARVDVLYAQDCFVEENIAPGFYEVSPDGRAVPRTQPLQKTEWFLNDPRNGEHLAQIHLNEKAILSDEEKQKFSIFSLHASSALSTVRLQKSLDLLDSKTREMRGIFDLINQGIFTLGADLKIRDQYSPALEAIFEKNTLAGQNFVELVASLGALNQEEKDRMSSVLAMGIGYDVVIFDSQKNILPKEMTLTTPSGTKIVEVDWLPILQSGEETVNRYLVTVRDMTTVRALRLESERAKEDMQILSELINCGNVAFLQFFESCSKWLARIQTEIKKSTPDLSIIKDVLHSIKGDARTRGLCVLSRVVHDAETEIAKLNSTTSTDIVPIIERIVISVDFYRVSAFEKLQFQEESRNATVIAMQDHLVSLGSLRKQNKNIDVENLFPSAFDLAMSHGVNCFARIVNSMETYVRRVESTMGVQHNFRVKAEEDFVFSSEAFNALETTCTHLVTNSLDHGLQGKGGEIHIQVEDRDQQVIFKLSDTGRGLALSKIRKKAQELGLCSEKTSLRDEEIGEFIFAPDFSTAGQVTETSGRGVGMSAVRSALNEIGGSIHIFWTTELKEGFRKFEFHISLPKSHLSQKIPFLYRQKPIATLSKTA